MRGVLLVVGGLVIAGAVWLLASQDASSPTDLGTTADPTKDETQPGPSLSGRSAPVQEAIDPLAPSVRGFVVDSDGKPLAGVSVVARRQHSRIGRVRVLDSLYLDVEDEPLPIVARAISDGQGRFTLADMEALKLHEVHAEVSPPRTSSWKRVRPGQGAAPIRIRVGNGTLLRGRVIDRDGRGVGAWVHGTTYRDQQDESYIAPTRTDEAGRFAFTVPSPSSVRLGVSVRGHGMLSGYLFRVPRTEEVIVRFDTTGGGTLQGTISDTSGAPVPKAAVSAVMHLSSGAHLTRLARADASGSFTMSGLPPGRVADSLVRAPGFIDRSATARGLSLGENTTHSVDVTLIRGATITGRVVTPDGTSIAGAHVLYNSGDQRHLFSGRNGLVRSDANGRYAIQGLAPTGGGALEAEASGFYQLRLRGHGTVRKTQYVSIDREGQRVEVDIVLQPGTIPITGRVQSHTGEPVANARISFDRPFHRHMGHDPLAGLTISEFVSDADGRFRHAGLLALSDWTVKAHHPAYIAAAEESVEIPAEPTDKDVVTLVMGPGARVEGRVVFPSGAPAVGVPVTVDMQSVVTSRDGSFVVAGLSPGKHTASASSHHHADPDSRQAVTVTWGQVVAGVRLVTPELRVLAGVVVDDKGRPAPGEPVEFRLREGSESFSTQVTSDVDGRFSFSRVPPGRLRVAAGDKGEPEYVDGSRTDLRLVAVSTPVVSIHGRVFAPDGTPAAGGSIRIRRVQDGWTWSSGDNPITNGEFRYEEQGTGAYSVKVTALTDRHGRPIAFLPVRDQAFDPSSESPMVFRLEAGQTISGRVVDEAGHPVAAVGVSMLLDDSPLDDALFPTWGERRSSRTDAEGRFQFSGLPANDTTLSFRPPSQYATPEPVTVPAGTRDVSVVLSASGRIAGLVLSADGEPVSDVSLAARALKNAEPSFDTRSDKQGRFEFVGLNPALRYRIAAMTHQRGDSDHLGTRVDNVAVGREDVSVRMRPAGRIQGRVVSEDGTPIPAHPNVRIRHGEELTQTHADRSGAFHSNPLKPGVYHVSVQGEGEWGASVPIEVRVPGEAVELVLPRGYPIRGQVVGLKELGFHAVALVDGKRVAATAVDETGRFVFSQSEQRTVTVFVHMDDDPRYGIVPRARGRTDVTVTLKTGNSIEGRIEGHKIETSTRVTATQAGKTLSARPKADGSFRILGLPEGLWTVYVYDSKLQVRRDVPAGARDIRLGPREGDAAQVPQPTPATQPGFPAPPPPPAPEPLPEPVSSCGACGGGGGA